MSGQRRYRGASSTSRRGSSVVVIVGELFGAARAPASIARFPPAPQRRVSATVHREAQSQHHAVGSIDVGAASPSRRLLDVASRLSVVVIVGQLSARVALLHTVR
jgi:hypothetical protein